MNKQLSNNLRQLHHQRFGGEHLAVRSPGRVNLIGEHTDYNNGFVLPAAVDKAVYVAVAKRTDDEIHLYSKEFNQEHRSTVPTVAPSDKEWPNYVLGVVDQLNKRGYKVGGFNLVVDGDVPVGAGMSSSAALECAVAFALNELFGLNVPKMEIPEIGQKTEHTFAGAMVGIMDPFASVFGKKDHVIKLDCQSLNYEYVPLQLEGYKVVLLNTNVKHSLASSEYNTRRKECEAGVALLQEAGLPVKSLRDATMDMLQQHVQPKNALVFQRCKYVVEENERLLSACDSLQRGDVKGLGQKMYGSHHGLSKEYEVSCKELDFLVDAVRGNEAVLGARMMGGGFGGCTINIMENEAVEDVVHTLGKRYSEAMGLEMTAYVVQTADGTSVVQ